MDIVAEKQPPDPVPLDSYIDALWRAVKADAITWDELNELQLRYVNSKAPIPLPSIEAILAQARRP